MAAMGVFDQRDENGIAVLPKEDIEGDGLLEAQETAAACPALAIRIE